VGWTWSGYQHASDAPGRGGRCPYLCADNWEEEMGTVPPDDPQAMVKEYFDEVMEQYEITDADVAVEYEP